MDGTAQAETASPVATIRMAAVPKWWQGWGPLLLLPVLLPWLVPSDWPRWVVMWSLAFAIFCGCKWLTWRRTPIRGASPGRHLGYLVGWPGLDAVAFLDPRRTAATRPTRLEWAFAAVKLALGLAVVFGLARIVPDEDPYFVGWVGMIGIVFVLHFGTFHLLSCAWRAAGVEARPLMSWPLLATSLGDFWGRRWNTAFRDLTHRFLFRPLTPRLGARGAVLVGFAFSGLVHDAVISLPSGGGYGGPTFFFLIQGVGLLLERSRIGRAAGLGKGWRGRLFAMTLLVAPVGGLFHRPFVNQVVVPFLHALGAAR